MRTRGRISAASLAVAPIGIEPTAGLAAPEGLTPAEARSWHEIMAALPSNWIRPEGVPLLTAYVRAISRAQRVAELIQAMERSNLDIPKYQSLLRLEQEISRTISTIA